MENKFSFYPHRYPVASSSVFFDIIYCTLKLWAKIYLSVLVLLFVWREGREAFTKGEETHMHSMAYRDKDVFKTTGSSREAKVLLNFLLYCIFKIDMLYY